MKLFMDYDWPGNIRELENEIKRVCTLAGEEELIEPEMVSPHFIKKLRQLPVDLRKSFGDKSFEQVRNETEREFIIQALKQFDYNKSICARNLGMSRLGFKKKMKRLGIFNIK
jgi:transcriptional regulator with PAS, ATPase and Fis domain